MLARSGRPGSLTGHSNRTKAKPLAQRRQSAPSLIISKALTMTKCSTVSNECVSHISPDSCALVQSLLITRRKLAAHGNVRLQTGLQTQERYLFLFTDILIISKAKSISQVKQKACVRVCEMWTASCMDEVCEGTTSPDRSFVIGWPTYNCVATFSTAEQKERWSRMLESRIREEKLQDDPNTIPLKIYAKDSGNCAYSKTFSISNTDCTSDIITTALQQFGLQGNVKDYQLWVTSCNDEPPYPLIGHEFPYSIKMNHIRARKQDLKAPPHQQVALLPDDTYCQFILRPRRMNHINIQTDEQRSKRKIPLLSWAFRRNSETELEDHLRSSTSPGHTPGCLFGQPLSNVIVGQTLPPSIKDMMVCLCNEGSATHGIFRRSAGVKACQELRHKLDSGDHVSGLNKESVIVIAAVFKEFLRNIPGSLLGEGLYEQWLKVLQIVVEREEQERERKMEDCRLQAVQRLIQLLPEENRLLLRHVVAMLHCIQSSADLNQMNSSNLAVCIAPSLLWGNTLHNHEEEAKRVCDLVCYLIDNCHSLFGDDITSLLTDLSLDSSSNLGSEGSLQQMSDSCYESLENELNAEPEDRPLFHPLKAMPSRDSLISRSDCDLDQSESIRKPESSLPLARIVKFTPAVRQPRCNKLRRCSEPVCGQAPSSMETANTVRKASFDSSTLQEAERNKGEEDEKFLEHSFQQLKLTWKVSGTSPPRRRNQTPLTKQRLDITSSRLSSPGTFPTDLSAISFDSSLCQNGDGQCSFSSSFQSPQGSSPKRQSETPYANIFHNGHPVTSITCNLLDHPDISYEDSSSKELSCKSINPPSYHQALKHISKSAAAPNPTNIPANPDTNAAPTQTILQAPSILQQSEARSLFFRSLECPAPCPKVDLQVSPAPQTLSPNCSEGHMFKASRNSSTDVDSRKHREVMLPLSVFFGQSCRLTLQKSRNQTNFFHDAIPNQPWRARGLDSCPSAPQNGQVYYKQAVFDREEVSRTLNAGSRHHFISYTHQWAEDLKEGLHAKESFV